MINTILTTLRAQHWSNLLRVHAEMATVAFIVIAETMLAILRGGAAL